MPDRGWALPLHWQIIAAVAAHQSVTEYLAETVCWGNGCLALNFGCGFGILPLHFITPVTSGVPGRAMPVASFSLSPASAPGTSSD